MPIHESTDCSIVKFYGFVTVKSQGFVGSIGVFIPAMCSFLQLTAQRSRNAYRINECESVLLHIVLQGQWKGQIRAGMRSRQLVVSAFKVSINVESDRYDTQCVIHTRMIEIFH